MAHPEISYSRIGSPLGDIFLAATPKGLCCIGLGEEEDSFRRRLEKFNGQGAVAAACPPAWAEAFQAYFEGRIFKFDLPLDILCGTPFQRRVWGALQAIPYGQTRSYSWLAQAAGSPLACRAVGRANGCNPLPIVLPCHRVVQSNGSLGGYSAGVWIKDALLRLEARHKRSLP